MTEEHGDPYQHDAQPLSESDLYTTTPGPYGLQDLPVGEEVWLPASMIRPGGFRAVKVVVVDRASAGSYERDHALDEWGTEAEADATADGGRQ